MKQKLLHLFCCLGTLLLFGVAGPTATAQTTVTITATGTAGSFNTGSVTPSGVKNDDLVLDVAAVSGTVPNNIGFIKFDLSTIPTGATVTAVNVKFYAYNTLGTSSATNNISGFIGDPATLSGSTIWSTINASAYSSTTNFSATTWSVGTTTSPSLNTISLNTNGRNFVQSNAGSTDALFGFVRGGTNPYTFYGYGSTTYAPQLEVTYTPGTACAGPVALGTASTSASAVCPSVPFTLSVSGTTTGVASLSLQWQRDSAGVWVNVPGAVGTPYTSTTTVSNIYRLRGICTATSDTTYSSSISVSATPFLNCYCTSSAATGYTSYSDITRVAIGGLDNTGTCASLTGSAGTATGTADLYSDFTGSVTAPTLYRGIANSLTVRTSNCNTFSSTSSTTIAWVDFNHNGSFADAGEQVSVMPYGAIAASGAATNTVSMLIPATADTGLTRMRVSVRDFYTTFTSCDNSFAYGETEDYYVSISTPASCSGAPSGGTAFSSASNVCSGVSFTLTDTAYSSTLFGVSLVWQRRTPSGTGTWTSVASATGPTFTTSQTATTDYRFKVTCTITGDSAFSNVVTVNQNPALACYCGPSTGVALNTDGYGADFIKNVRIAQTTMNSTAVAPPTSGLSTGYTLTLDTPVMANTAELGQGATYPIFVRCSSGAQSLVAWVDYNGDGLFGTTEGISLTKLSSSDTVAYGVLNVPIGAVPGLTGMRIRSNQYTGYYSPSTPCTLYGFSYGETEDRRVTIATTAGCSGVLAAGTVTGPSGVCPGTTFLLTDTTDYYTASSAVSGFSFQWQSSPTGAGTWTNLVATGATTPVVATSQTAGTDYRFIVKCAATGDSLFAGPYTVAMNPATSCYCTPTYALYGYGCLYGYTIDSIVINGAGGTGINQPNTGCTGAGYANYATLDTIDMVQAITYTGSVSEDYAFGNYGYKVWIDFGDDGVFGPTDSVTSFTKSSGASIAFNIPIPSGAAVGTHRMRVRMYAYPYGANVEPCADWANGGETHDYTVNVLPNMSCFDVYPTGTVAASDSAVCVGQNYTLSLAGTTTATGIDYQWMKDSAGVWVAIPTATGPTLTISQSVPTTYHVVLNCPLGLSKDSTADFTVVMDTFLNCYCSPGFTSSVTGYPVIVRTQFGTLNQTSNCTTVASGPGSTIPYANYTTLTPTVILRGTTIPYIIKDSSCAYGGYYTARAVFIDTNHNGIFDVPSERFIDGGTWTIAPATLSGALFIPGNTRTGLTRMRVITSPAVSTGSSVNPCAPSYYGGEAEDYLLDIQSPPVCSGTPNAGTLAADDSTVCTGQVYTLSTAGVTTDSGTTYQYQRDSAGVWVNVAGATLPFYSTTQTANTTYRLVSTCAVSGLSNISNSLTITQNPFLDCYCVPDPIYSPAYYYNIVRTNVGTLNRTSNCATVAPGPGSVAGEYANYTTVDTTVLLRGTSVPYTIKDSACFYTTGRRMALFVDFNRDGVFDTATERLYETPVYGPGSTSASMTQSGAFTVPMSASLGLTRMRVMTHTDYSAFYPVLPCGDINYYYGEAEDYMVNIVSPPVCSGTPNAGTLSADDSTVCVGQTYTLTASGITTDSGTTYQYQRDSAGVWVNVSGATLPFLSTTQTATTTYRLVSTCAVSGLTNTSSSLTITQNSYMACYCTPSALYGCSFYGQVNSFSLLGGAGSTSINQVSTGCTGTGFADYTTTVDTVNLQQTVTYSGSISTGSFTYGSDLASIWIDMNDDGVFGSSEALMSAMTISTTGTPYSITIPASASLGVHRMRVRAVAGAYTTTLDACSTGYYYAEAHDFLVNIVSPPSCAAPDTLTATSITASGATLNWTPGVAGTAASYTLAYGPTGFTPGTGGTTVTGITGTSYTVTGLSSGVSYQFYLKAICSSTDSSGFSAPATFTTILDCGLLPSLTCGTSTTTSFSGSGLLNVTACGFSTPGQEKYYRFKAPITGTYSLVVTSASSYVDYFYKDSASSPTCNSVSGYNCIDDIAFTGTFPIGTLTGGNTYYFLLDPEGTSSISHTFNISCPAFPPTNDSAAFAAPVTIGAGCTTASMTNVLGTMGGTEPMAACAMASGSTGFSTVWYKFTAPASGLVRISTDFSVGTLSDTRIALYSATDSTNYSTFSILGCDDDNGVVSGSKSIIYSPQLTAGQTYYVQVMGGTSTATGTFCLQVASVDSSMLSSTASCATAQVPFSGGTTGYTSWFNLVDNNGDLVATIRVPAGTNVANFSGAVTVNTSGTPRYEFGTTGRRYLDRNWSINDGGTATSADVMFPYRSSEGVALGAAAGLTTGQITRQTGTTCVANYLSTAGTTSVLTTTLTGITPTVRYVMATTPGFSNFYLFADTTGALLQASGLTVRATNVEDRNRVNWTNSKEAAGTSYEVQRSADGRSFTTIALATGTGSGVTYTHWDAQPFGGLNYYRILATAPTGDRTVSGIVSAYVAANGGFVLQAFPNPLTGAEMLSVRASGPRVGTATVAITDLTGKVLRTATLETGATEASFDLNAFASGVYFVRYTDDARTETVKVTKR